MNHPLKIARTVVALCFSTLAFGGCSNSSDTASVAATVTLNGSYIASENGKSLALLFNSQGCMFGTDASYNSASQVTTANWLFKGAHYSIVGTTVRVTGGTETSYGQMLEAAHGGSSGGGNTLLFTLANSGQSLVDATGSGQALEFIKQ